MISPKGRKSREAMVRSFQGIISKKVGNEAFAGADEAGRLSAMFQQNAITNSDIVKIFGSGEEFLDRYANFEQKYFDALSNRMNTSKTNRIIADFHKKRGIINLNLLDREAQEELSTLFKSDVMRVESLMRQVGLPSIELPSANLYRSAFKFNVDNSQGIAHPAQILLNRNIFNFNPEKKGMESISLGGRNMFSSKSLKEMMAFFESNAGNFKAQMNPFGVMKAGEKVFTFDVETTGIAANSQVRSFAGVEMQMGPSGKLSVIDSNVPNRGFAAADFNGMKVKNLNGATQTLNDFILEQEIPLAQRRTMGIGGENFLDEASDFIERMLQADKIAGHNVHFDLTMLTSTMMGQAGFNDHERAGKVLGQLYDRIDKGNYLVDTLESTRMYLQEKARVLSSGVGGTVDEQSQAFIKALMAPETRAKIAIGGSSSYADVANIALNTNLFELIEKEGQAETLFDQISRGSHIAETDVHLQSYIGKFVASGELDIVTDVANRSKFGNFARNVIAKSAATTATTSIADIAHLNETVFDYIKQNTAGVTVKATAGEIGLVNAAADLEGILSYSKDAGGYVFSTADDQFNITDSVARSHIQGVLERARSIELSGGTRDVMTFASGAQRSFFRNLENEKIISTGVSFGTRSRMLEIAGLSAGTGTSISADTLTQTLGMTYSELGTGISMKDQIRSAFGKRPIDPVFQYGIADYSEATSQKVAKAFGEIGDKYAGVLDMRSRVFSTLMANATADVGRVAAKASVAAEVDSKLLAHTANSRLMGEFGFSYFQSQKRLRMFDIGKDTQIASSRIMVPQEILKEAMSQAGLGDTKMKVGLSKAFDVGEERAARINAVWHLGEQINKDEARSLAERLLDLTSDESEIKRILKASGGEFDKQMREDIAISKVIKDSGNRGQTIENLTDMIMNRGIVVGYNEGRTASAITDVLNVTGKLTETDVDMVERAVIHESGLVGGYFKAGPFVDEKAVAMAGKMAEYEAASEIGASGISKALEAQSEVARTIEDNVGLKTKLGTIISGAKTGIGENKALSFYTAHKGKIGIGAGLVAGAFLGYYKYQQHRKDKLYNETMDAQPTQKGVSVDQYNSSANSNAYSQMRYSDPLSTAGIVGNLDRMKIGHAQMGNSKYNHLYGG